MTAMLGFSGRVATGHGGRTSGSADPAGELPAPRMRVKDGSSEALGQLALELTDADEETWPVLDLVARVKDGLVFPQAALNSPGVLMIPALGLEQGVARVPIRDGDWDISNLGTQVGHLQATGLHPGADLAMTFVGHVTADWPDIPPFVDLNQLEYGDEVVYRWNTLDFVYRVDDLRMVSPKSVDSLFLEDGNSIVLVTCSNWNYLTQGWAKRLLLRARLVEIRRVTSDAAN